MKLRLIALYLAIHLQRHSRDGLDENDRTSALCAPQISWDVVGFENIYCITQLTFHDNKWVS